MTSGHMQKHGSNLPNLQAMFLLLVCSQMLTSFSPCNESVGLRPFPKAHHHMMPTTEAAAPASRAPFQSLPSSSECPLCCCHAHPLLFPSILVCTQTLLWDAQWVPARRNCVQQEHRGRQAAKPAALGFPPCHSVLQQPTWHAAFPHHALTPRPLAPQTLAVTGL